ncbi:MAG: ergothioneine biosynthesis protein EgtB [Wenzhouxiangellaceae bacterium]
MNPTEASASPIPADRDDELRVALANRFRQVRDRTEALVEPLTAEDQNLQSMPEASPVKWHRAHTSWFFETFLLKPHLPDYREFDPRFEYLFNSYYNAVGEQFPRPKRALISRPDAAGVGAYRKHVDQAMQRLLAEARPEKLTEVSPMVELGLNHEQQHQELILTDLKHALSFNPCAPVLGGDPDPAGPAPHPLKFFEYEGGKITIGHRGAGFSFDNETPAHEVLLRPFALASRPATWREWLAFISDGGYRNPLLWLSDGWAWVQKENIEAPLYLRCDEHDGWQHYTLAGWKALEPTAPACHIGFYEAHAFAEWAGERLPTEAEWETAAGTLDARFADQGHFADSGRYQPEPVAPRPGSPTAMFGTVWEWTSSSYAPYPGFRAAPGAVGEYNGKFMANQMVLRGGSCATPAGHVRPTYRNFFYPPDRWQFSGVRLAHDL